MISSVSNLDSGPTEAQTATPQAADRSTTSPGFLDLPYDSIVHICAHFLKPIHIAHLSATCRRNKFVSDNDLIWRHKVEKDFGPDWREWELANRVPDDGPRPTFTEDEMLQPGQYLQIYKYLDQFRYILDLHTEAFTDWNYLVKLMIVGDNCVGKTSLMRRLTHNDFSEAYHSTIGLDWRTKSCKTRPEISESIRLKLQIWDSSGTEGLRMVTATNYRGTQIFFVTFSVDHRHTFANVGRWMEEIQRYSYPLASSIVFLVGTKADNPERRQVTKTEAIALARELGVQYFETSSKVDEGVERLFLTAASVALRNLVGFDRLRLKPVDKPSEQGWISSVISRVSNLFK